MNPYIYPILLDKTKIEFIKDVYPDLPQCKDILIFFCNYYETSANELLGQRQGKLKKYFIYICCKIHDPWFIEHIKRTNKFIYKRQRRGRNIKRGLKTSINSLTPNNIKINTLSAIRKVLSYIEIYKKDKEELLNLERNLLKWWNGW